MRIDIHDPEPIRFLDAEGTFAPNESAQEYLAEIEALDTEEVQEWYRAMVRARAFDTECTNLQRQGQLALWAPSLGQEGCQAGLAFAAEPQDHLFPAYREHLVADVRGVSMLDLAAQFRGLTHGGWDVNDPKNGNFHLYTLVLGAQAQHAQGFALGMVLEAKLKAGDNALDPGEAGTPTDAAVISFYGDGTTSQGDANEALVFAQSYQSPTVFVVQNNQYAISVPVARQSRTPIYRRAVGFGIPAVQIDGNDALAAYAVGKRFMRHAREGHGPSYIEALTYRIGAHTTSDDPTRYRENEELDSWRQKDPIVRLAGYLRSKGVPEEFFETVDAEATTHARTIRDEILALPSIDTTEMFDHVYAEQHPRIDEQREWALQYEASYDDQAAAPSPAPVASGSGQKGNRAA